MKKLFALVLTMMMIVTLGFAVMTYTSLDYADQGTKNIDQVESVNLGPLGDPYPPPDEG